MMMIPSRLFSIAQDAPVFARMQLLHKNKDDDGAAANMDVTFFPIPNSLDDDDLAQPVAAAATVVKNCVLRYGNNTEIQTYLVLDQKPIGFSDDGSGIGSCSASVMVYRAVWQLTTNRCVALKVADNPESMAKLREEVARSLVVKGEHINLLRLKTYFMDEQSGKFCVVMPLTHGSLRTIMLHKNHWFSQDEGEGEGEGEGGFPERYVISVLKFLLCALTFLHSQQIFHGDISTAHIYLCNLSHPLYYHCSHIALGFAATIYEDNNNDEASPSFSSTKWAAAPEIYYGNQPYSEKADIWLVGITALELVYGADLLLKLTNRNALEAIIKEIHDNKKLPTNINIYHHTQKKKMTNIHTILKEAKKGKEDETMMNKLKFYIQKWVPPISSSSPEIAGTFAEIVVQCLDSNPKNRPTAKMLLSHPRFKHWHAGIDDFQFYSFALKQ